MEKQVILLNGPSSSGKSTLASTLQRHIKEETGLLYPVISIDDFMKLATDETIYEDDVYEISGDMCASALESLKTSPGVIIDHVITSERIFCQLTTILADYLIRMAHIHCPLAVLLAREMARKNRCIGSSEASYTYLFPKDGYDLTLDTSVMSPAECAKSIYEKWIQP